MNAYQYKQHRRLFMHSLVGAGVLLFLGTVRAVAQPTLQPNILFIMADDMGYGDLGCYGQERIKTPHIDRLAAEGMRFTDCYAGSTICAPRAAY